MAKFTYSLSGINGTCGSNFNVKIFRLIDSTDLMGGALIATFNAQASNSWSLDNGYYRVDVYVTNTNFSCTVASMMGSWKEGTKVLKPSALLMETYTGMSTRWEE